MDRTAAASRFLRKIPLRSPRCGSSTVTTAGGARLVALDNVNSRLVGVTLDGELELVVGLTRISEVLAGELGEKLADAGSEFAAIRDNGIDERGDSIQLAAAA